MKILHLCLAQFYIDNNSYQENILPKMHKKMGNEVRIVASTETYVDKKNLGYVNPSKYINEDGIEVIRIPYKKIMPSKIIHKLRIYKGLYGELSNYSPDFIFIHDIQFLSIATVKKYLKKHPNVQAVADGHADFCNSAKTFLSYKILHKIIYKHCAKIIEPFVSRFYGTLPARVDFFREVYQIDDSKISLLPMGADDDIIQKIEIDQSNVKIRKNLNIDDNDFLIVTGGKLNKNRLEVLDTLKAVATLNCPNLKIIFFGNVADDYVDEFQIVAKSSNVIDVGWQPTSKTYEYMAAADLVIFPGLHSVMWEQAVALGKPCIFKKMEGFTHVDLGGNAIFLDDTSTESILNNIKDLIYLENGKYSLMKKNANSPKKERFYYSNIAKESIFLNKEKENK